MKRSTRSRTFGPIANLEQHLSPEWWRELFGALYLRTDGDVVENDANTVGEIDALIRATGIEPHHRLLDLCCGQGRHCIELARRGYRHVTGLDRSRYLVRLARRRIRDLGYPVDVHEGDARRLRGVPAASVDCLFVLGNSFGYFEAEDDDVRVLAAIGRALRDGGTLVMDLTDGAWIRAHFEPRSWEWIGSRQIVCRERALTADGSRLVSRELVVDSKRGVTVDQFYAERLYSRAAITRLVEANGFHSVRLHENLRAESSRGQDLGMMSNRMLLTAQRSLNGHTPGRSRRR